MSIHLPHIFSEQKRWIAPIVCFIFLLIPNIATMVLCTDLTYSLVKEVTYIAVVVVCLLIPTAFLKKRTYFIVEGVVSLIGFPIEIASLYLNQMTVSPHFIGIIVETNRSEASELLSSIGPWALLVLIIWGTYGIMVTKMENDWFFPWKWRKYLLLLLPTIFILGVIGTSFVIPPKGKQSIGKTILIAVDNFTTKFYKIYPFDLYLSAHQLYKEKVHIQELTKQLQSFSFGLEQKNDSIEEHYIFMIGEAARYDHFHINGYERNTSPQLDTIVGIISLANIYTQANLTYYSLPCLLTRKDLNSDDSLLEKTIIEAYQEAGFQTAWLSCQTIMNNTQRIYQTTDFHHEEIGGLSSEVAYDSILPILCQEIANEHPCKKSFFLLHTMGSHFKYNQRHPQAFEQFTPAMHTSDGYTILDPNNKDIVINSYDNTILFTDFVIAQTIAQLQRQKGIRAFFYIADHGENLYDDERHLAVHGSYEGTIHEAHVPCFVWFSDEFREAYPEKVEAIEKNKNKQLSTNIVFHTLADMGGLSPIVDSTKSIFSPSLFEQDTIRMLSGDGTIKIIQTEYTNH